MQHYNDTLLVRNSAYTATNTLTHTNSHARMQTCMRLWCSTMIPLRSTIFMYTFIYTYTYIDVYTHVPLTWSLPQPPPLSLLARYLPLPLLLSLTSLMSVIFAPARGNRPAHAFLIYISLVCVRPFVYILPVGGRERVFQVTYLATMTKGTTSINDLIDKYSIAFERQSRRRGLF